MAPPADTNPQLPPSLVPPGAATDKARVVLLYKRHAPDDEYVLRMIERELTHRGFNVWVDRHLSLGIEWAKEVERRIRTADAVVPLLSSSSIQSEMFCFEIENAHDAAQEQHGSPRLLPVRIELSETLPEPLGGILDQLVYARWDGKQDDIRVVGELVAALDQVPRKRSANEFAPKLGVRPLPQAVERKSRGADGDPTLAPAPAIEPIGGAVPLSSKFYLTRPADAELRTALIRYDSIVLIKGSRQIGKTSLLARGLQFTRERGAKVALTDFQKFNASNLESVTNVYLALAESLADQLELETTPAEEWDERRGANANFDRYLRKQVLGKLNAPLVWGMDEVDRLFVCPFGSEVFGLFRSWHNERALDPSGPWAGLTLLISYATEAHLFIRDLNQSPFNVGTRLALDDFTKEQIVELNWRHGEPLKNEAEVGRFIKLLGGHPYLVRKGLHELATAKTDLATFEASASSDEYIYGDHLRRILVLLAKDQVLSEAVRGLLWNKGTPATEHFYRLRSAGVVLGASQSEVTLRCQLYRDYLSRHLL